MSLLNIIIQSSYRGLLLSSVLLKAPRYIRCIASTQKLFCPDSKRFNDSPQFKAFKAKQAKMQCDDGYPVHLKGGIIDKILYHVTVGACIINLVQCFWLFYLLATEKSG